jgi:hypothetical protein
VPTIGVSGAQEAKRHMRTRYEQLMLLREFSDWPQLLLEVVGGFFLVAGKGCHLN